MTVARITTVELYSEEVVEEFSKTFNSIRKTFNPEPIACTGIQTGPTSYMIVAVYESDEVAQAALPGRQKVVEHVAKYVKDVWHMEGPVPHHQFSDDFLEQLNQLLRG